MALMEFEESSQSLFALHAAVGFFVTKAANALTETNSLSWFKAKSVDKKRKLVKKLVMEAFSFLHSPKFFRCLKHQHNRAAHVELTHQLSFVHHDILLQLHLVKFFLF